SEGCPHGSLSSEESGCLRRQSVVRGRIGYVQFVLAHVHADVIEQRRRQIALAGVRQHAQHGVSRLRTLADLKGPGECRASRDADEDALLLREFAAPFHGVRPGYGENPADHAHVYGVARNLRNEIGAPALHRMRLECRVGLGWRTVWIAFLFRAAGKHRRVGRLAYDDFRIRSLLGEYAGDALERATGSESGNP